MVTLLIHVQLPQPRSHLGKKHIWEEESAGRAGQPKVRKMKNIAEN